LAADHSLSFGRKEYMGFTFTPPYAYIVLCNIGTDINAF